MIVAISQRNMPMVKGANRDALENDYVQYYEQFELTLVPIPNVCKNLDVYFENMPIQGIILTGGNSINPMLYGAEFIGEDFSNDRDRIEKQLIEIALDKKLPLFANCRGVQFLNVFFGGKLVQDIKKKTKVNHIAVEHKIKIIDEKAVQFLGKEEFTVNSYHQQGIDRETLSPELKPFAISADGIIEGIYHPKYPLAGVMWHLERPGSDREADKKFIRAFINKEFFWGA